MATAHLDDGMAAPLLSMEGMFVPSTRLEELAGVSVACEQHPDLLETSLHDHHAESRDPPATGRQSSCTYMLMSEARKNHRTQSLMEMLKVNIAMSEVYLDDEERNDVIW
jgi:hypothetical protein